MRISSQTKISKIIKHNIEAIEVIASINSNFNKLRNPILRTILAPRVSVADASKIGKCDIHVILDALEKIGFEIESNPNSEIKSPVENAISTNQFIQNCELIKFDIRPVIAQNNDPLSTIMDILKSLDATKVLEITSSFEPIPLMRILEKKNFDLLSTSHDNLYQLYIKKTGSFVLEKTMEESSEGIDKQTILSNYQGRIQEIDVRNLEMPLPFITIMEALQNLSDDHLLLVHHKRIPQFLLPEIEQIGFHYTIFEIEYERVELIIYKKNDNATKQY